MHNAQADPTLLGYLGRALSLELSAVQLYSTQARLVATWGLAETSAQLGAEAYTEMAHVERILTRMLALGVAPGASQLRPVQLGSDLLALLRIDLAQEVELVAFYADAVRFCDRSGYHDDRLFFATLLHEEQAHEQTLKAWIEQLAADLPEAELGRRLPSPPVAARRRGATG